ncbi:cytochrome c [Rhodoferax aquaticus]|uniref:cytochrome c n=1 Tax=Rhodoferax aquaticus TaxID=2527691 RepID=UPI003CCA361D
MTKRIVLRLKAIGVLAGLLLGLVAAVAYLNVRGEDPIRDADTHAAVPRPTPMSTEQVARGRYLTQVGNCAGCHTRQGGAPLAGGRGLATPFGTVYTSNLTPDPSTGLGRWSEAEFWRAMHHGRSKDGRLLTPAFPYASYTHVTREDANAIYAYLQSLPPVEQAPQAHALRFPYNTQAALAVWRALYFRAADPAATLDNTRSPEWNRGAYLARGLGHCVECHSPRNALGATSTSLELTGGGLSGQGWYAPSLASAQEAGVSYWRTEDVVQLLKTGRTALASVQGPMAEVVYGSTQHWTESDLFALSTYLQAIPQVQTKPSAKLEPLPGKVQVQGAAVYDKHCAQCHGPQGQGATGAYPALAGNRAVTLARSDNLIAIVRAGGFAPVTPGNPQPYGMPPFSHVLTNADIAAVVSYIRTAWGNQAAPVSELEVLRLETAH